MNKNIDIEKYEEILNVLISSSKKLKNIKNDLTSYIGEVRSAIEEVEKLIPAGEGSSIARTKNKADMDKIKEDFEKFWEIYPKKEGGKNKVFEKFKILCTKHSDEYPGIEFILKKIRQFRMTKKWEEGFIVMPATFINQRRWNDIIYETKKEMKRSQLRKKYGKIKIARYNTTDYPDNE